VHRCASRAILNFVLVQGTCLFPVWEMETENPDSIWTPMGGKVLDHPINNVLDAQPIVPVVSWMDFKLRSPEQGNPGREMREERKQLPCYPRLPLHHPPQDQERNRHCHGLQGLQRSLHSILHWGGSYPQQNGERKNDLGMTLRETLDAIGDGH